MKYSVIILNLTIMLGSVMLKRPSPFIFFKNTSVRNTKPMLPIDGWLDPFKAINDYNFKLLCEETLTAQRIKYSFQRKDTNSEILNLYSIEGDKVIITIKNDEETGIAGVVMGRKCEKEPRMIFTQNSNYEGLLLIEIDVYSKINTVVTFTGITVMNYLSYEDAVTAAIDLFKNPLIKDEDSHNIQLQKARICVSLFRGLSSTLIEAYTNYFVRIKFMQSAKSEKRNHLKCEGIKEVSKTNAPFIKYVLYFNESYRKQTLTILHGDNGFFTTANSIYL